MRYFKILSTIILWALIISQASAYLSDIDNSPWKEDIEYLYNAEIITGHPDLTYRPLDKVNRAEFTTIISRAYGQEIDPSHKNCFPDVNEQWFAKYVCFAKEKGWVFGYPDGFFQPENTITKAEILVIMGRRYLWEVEIYEDDLWYMPYVRYAYTSEIVDTLDMPDWQITRETAAKIIYRQIYEEDEDEALEEVTDDSQNEDKIALDDDTQDGDIDESDGGTQDDSSSGSSGGVQDDSGESGGEANGADDNTDDGADDDTDDDTDDGGDGDTDDDTGESANDYTYTLTNYQAKRPEQWNDYFYGSSVEKGEDDVSYCVIRGGSYDRCGVSISIREVDYGLGVQKYEGLRFTIINLGDNAMLLKPYIRASWFDSDWSYALNGGIPVVQTDGEIEFGSLGPGEAKSFDIPWNEMNIPEFNHQEDYLAGILTRGGAEEIGIIKIELYGGLEAAPLRIETPHSGGYMVYKRVDGQESTYTEFNGTSWGKPFADQEGFQPGDILEVYGVINSGTIIGYHHGTFENPIIIRGMTEDAAFDLKGASKQGQNGGILTLYGNYYIIENLEFRNCGLPYLGHENASAFHTTTENTIFRNLKVHNCGDGWIMVGKNNVIENSDIYNNGYFNSGQTHNIYLSSGDGHIIRNNRIHHSGGQNLKVRSWNVAIRNNLFYHAGNFDVDFAGSDQSVPGFINIFQGNTVVKSNYCDNMSHFLTFFEDNLDLNIPGTLFITNNTFVGPNDERTSMFRIGKNKTIEAYNNVIFGVKKIKFQGATNRENGTLTGSHNWLQDDALYSEGLNNSVIGNDPGLESSWQIYLPSNVSPLVNGGSGSAPYIPTIEYNWSGPEKARFSDGAIDIGAFEFGG